MSHDASCVDSMTYFEGICSVFDYRIVFRKKSNIDRMRTALWPNVNFEPYTGFLQCFCSFLWRMCFFNVFFQILQAYYMMSQSSEFWCCAVVNDMQTRWLAPDHIFKAAHPLQNRLGQLWNYFGHMPGTKRTAGKPKITVPVPVLVLGTSDLGTQQWWTDSRVLVRSDALLEETPRAINDLCAAFGLDKAASEGILVRGQFDIARLSPHPFSFHFDSFLAVTLVDHEGDG